MIIEFKLGNKAVVQLNSEKFDDGKIADTEVQIQGAQVCWIAGEDIFDFRKDLEELISKYRI